MRNDLIQLERIDILHQIHLRAMQSVFAALDTCRDVIHITDSQHRVQVRYLNDLFFHLDFKT